MRIIKPLCSLALLGLFACGGGAEEPEEAPPTRSAEEEVMFVPDSTIEREVSTRIDADPRFDKEGVEIEVHAKDGDVTLVGTVPTRMEMSFAREVANSAPGVREVFLDSLEVLSEPKREEPRRGEEPRSAT